MRRCLLLLLCASTWSGTARAQDLRRWPAERISDSLLDAALRTPADTAALIRLALPVALDSLRERLDTAHSWPKVAKYPQLYIADELATAVDTAWLRGLVAAGIVRGICAPVRYKCRQAPVLHVELRDPGGIGDNAVHLVLGARSAPWDRGTRTIDVADAQEALVRRWEIGILQPDPVFFGRYTAFFWPVVGPHLVVTRGRGEWEIARWVP